MHFPPRTSGLRSAQPKKKPPDWATFLKIVFYWWISTTSLEPISSKISERKLSPEPREPKGSPPHAKKPLHFLISPAEIFLFYGKGVLLCGAALKRRWFGASRQRDCILYEWHSIQENYSYCNRLYPMLWLYTLFTQLCLLNVAD